jgi:hypothetical protein
VIPYCLPFLIAAFSFRVLTMIVSRFGGRSAGWLDAVLVFAVCYPENFLAEVLVAYAYLWRDSRTGSFLSSLSSEASHRAFSSDVLLLIARVVLRCVAWLLALMGFVLVEYVVVLIVLKVAHPGLHHPMDKALYHVLVEVAFVFFAGVCSRYSFVFPLFAFRETWHSDALVDGVRLAKRHWRVLGMLAMGVSAGLLLEHDLSRWALMSLHASRTADRAVQVVELTLTGVLTGYFTVLKTELMRRASEQEGLSQGTA